MLAIHWNCCHKLVIISNSIDEASPCIQEDKKKGVIAASAGNHALALAYHGQILAIPVVVVTPVSAPIMKVGAVHLLLGRLANK